MRFSSFNLGAGIFILALLVWGLWGNLGEYFSTGEPLTGLLGLIFVLAALFYFFLRRTGVLPGPGRLWAEIHILLGYAGVGLLLIHSGGTFLTWTGLLNLSLALILLLGLNLRFFSGRQSFRHTFSRLDLFAKPSRGGLDLEPILRKKESLLRGMDSRAPEGMFGLRPKDWLAHPWKAVRFLGLALAEKRRVRESCGSSPGYLRFSQGWGRVLHIILGVGVLAGLLLHLLRACPYFSL
jgi:hypothetical protein